MCHLRTPVEDKLHLCAIEAVISELDRGLLDRSAMKTRLRRGRSAGCNPVHGPRMVSLERAQVGGLVVPAFCPFDELYGQDEGDGEGDLAEALGWISIGVAAELSEV